MKEKEQIGKNKNNKYNERKKKIYYIKISIKVRKEKNNIKEYV